MHKLYKEDPYWQIPYILSGLKKKGLLIVNGCRSFLEVKRLKDLCSLVLIVEIRASTSARRKRLRLRDGTSRQEFKKIENDEMRITSLPKILQEDFVDIVIMNNDSLATLKVKAKKFASLILSFNFERMKSKNER